MCRLSDGQAVSTWTDFVADTQTITQGTGSAQPTYRATGGPGNIPCVEADGGDQLLLATGPTTAQPLTNWAIAKADNADTNTRTLLSGGTSSDPKIETIGGNWAINCGDPALDSGDADDANWHSFLGYHASSTVANMNLDGVEIASGDAGAGNSNVRTSVFYKVSPGEAWDGKCYFWGVFSGDLRMHENYVALEAWAAAVIAGTPTVTGVATIGMNITVNIDSSIVILLLIIIFVTVLILRGFSDTIATVIVVVFSIVSAMGVTAGSVSN